jgi:hypothetical protein
VDELVEWKPRRERDQIERRARFHQCSQGRAARDAGAMLLKRGARPRQARREQLLLVETPDVESPPGHGLDLGTQLAVAALERGAEHVELETRAWGRAADRRHA